MSESGLFFFVSVSLVVCGFATYVFVELGECWLGSR